jgi:hypothetical protein
VNLGCAIGVFFGLGSLQSIFVAGELESALLGGDEILPEQAWRGRLGCPEKGADWIQWKPNDVTRM